MIQLPGGLTVEALRAQIQGDVLENEPLKNRTTYRIGGSARLLVCPKDFEDLHRLNQLIQRSGVPQIHSRWRR